MKVLLRHVMGRLLASLVLVMMLGSGSLGLCWCNLLDTHECHDHSVVHVQLTADSNDCCRCELCSCCGQGTAAVPETMVSHQAPLQSIAFTTISDESCLRNLADEIFIPPKIGA